MSHNTGTLQTVAPVFQIGPDTGTAATSPNTWARSFSHTPAPSGTKFVMLHFRNVSLPANNRLEVDLGYDMDVFTSADGAEFWTRPVNIHVLAGGNVPIRYITDGAGNGLAEVDVYGRGERMNGTQDPTSLSNSDPFLPSGSYTEPTYDPFWFCDPVPVWENVGCVPGGDIRAQVAQSVGMIVSVHDTGLSTCSVTCIGPDLVITAGHCLAEPDTEVPSSSVIFNYSTDCGGNAPGGYAGRFFKVKALKKYRWDPGVADYAILQLKVPPGGINVPALPLRTSLPAIGEQAFGIHHPNGAVKKLAQPHPGFTTVSSAGSFVHVNDLDVSGGSSGSGLFDTAGRYLGTLSFGGSCSLNYYASTSILADIASTPAPPNDRHVMIVFDRSGSMSMNAGAGLGTKIEEARDAASLFVQLIRTGGGNRVGLVSFSTSANHPADYPLATVTNNVKTDLVGPAPYSGGLVGSLMPGGNTSIGDGLAEARDQLAGGGGNDTILLLTDGLQNTPPMIAAIAPTLASIDVHAIGFGSEASLDGTLLNQLTQTHNGMYTRAGSGLELKKFFALAFGNIFEAGTLSDPEFVLDAGVTEAKPLPISVCGEEVITAVVGWERPDTPLAIRLESPTGQVVNIASPGIEHDSGRTWMFMRVPLPHNGERDGTWKVIAYRPSSGGEFPRTSSDKPVRYFINVLAKGGPMLRNRTPRRRYYTGDAITPRVFLSYADGSVPHDAKATLDVDRPGVSVGTTLVQSSRVAAMTLDADNIPARFASLMALEQSAGRPLVHYDRESHALLSDSANTEGLMETPGVFGKRMEHLLKTEGNYRFHAKASYGEHCDATRELIWSLHVEVGIDPDHTQVTTEVLGTLPDGRRKVRVTLVPRDRYGNHLGPGRGEGLDMQPLPGSTPVHGLTDKGDGSYETMVAWDPDSGQAPGVVIVQPERAPTIVSDPSRLPTHKHLPWWLLWLLLLVILLLLVLLMT